MSEFDLLFAFTNRNIKLTVLWGSRLSKTYEYFGQGITVPSSLIGEYTNYVVATLAILLTVGRRAPVKNPGLVP